MEVTPYESGGFSSEDKEKQEKSRKPSPERVGSVLLGRHQEKDDKEEKPKRSLFERREKEEEHSSDKEKSSSEDETATETSEKPEDAEKLKEAARAAAIEKAEADKALLIERRDSAPEGSAEKVQSAAGVDYLERVLAALPDPELEPNPVIKAEAEKRIAIAEESLDDDSSEESDNERENVPSVGDVDLEPIETPSSEDSDDKVTTPTVTTSPTRSARATASTPPAPSGGGDSGSSFESSDDDGSDRGDSEASPRESITTSPVVRTGPRPPEADSRREQKSHRGRDLLAGGIIGYAIGRRGGKKRSEAKLKPENEVLAKEVATTKKHLEMREAQVKRMALEQREQNTIQATKEATKASPKIVEKLPVTEILRRSVIAPVEVEGAVTKTPEKAQTNPEIVDQKQIKRVEQLPTPDILKIAENLYISGVSVKRLYETNQIDRAGLIHIVKQGLEGKDLKSAFKHVELGQERQRERAREFRHDDVTNGSATSAITTPPSNPISSSLPPLHTPSPPTTLPNQPDQSSIQPISSEISNTHQEQAAQLEELRKMASTPKLAGPAIILAIALSLLILWLIF